MEQEGSMAILRSEELKNNRDEFIQNTFCKIFHRTALRYPDKTAVSDDNCSLTYRELDEYSNFLAKHLVSLGVRREEIVAIPVRAPCQDCHRDSGSMESRCCLCVPG